MIKLMLSATRVGIIVSIFTFTTSTSWHFPPLRTFRWLRELFFCRWRLLCVEQLWHSANNFIFHLCFLLCVLFAPLPPSTIFSFFLLFHFTARFCVKLSPSPWRSFVVLQSRLPWARSQITITLALEWSLTRQGRREEDEQERFHWRGKVRELRGVLRFKKPGSNFRHLFWDFLMKRWQRMKAPPRFSGLLGRLASRFDCCLSDKVDQKVSKLKKTQGREKRFQLKQ